MAHGGYNFRGHKIIINGVEQTILPGPLPLSPQNGWFAVDESDGLFKVYNESKNRWVVLGDAEDVVFDNSSNNFTANTVQDAIEEVSNSTIIPFFPQFQRIGTLNSDLYLFSHADQTSGSLSNARPSGSSSNGYRYGNASPIVCPFDGKVVKATFVIKGVAQSTGSASANVAVNCELWNVGFLNEGSKINDVIINIPSASYTIGNWWNSSINTDFIGDVNLDINVNQGQLLGLKFNSTTGNSNAVSIQNITLILEIQKT